jgi:hypothetical protein
MFDVMCQRHGHRVLLGNRRIEAITNDDTGIHVHYRCWCGEAGEFRTGRPRPKALVG